MPKRIFTFQRGASDRTADAAEALGLKGANLALLASLDVPVPPGFTIATSAWREAQGGEGGLPQALRAELRSGIEWLEGVTDRRFDGDERPLLLAVRTSARVQMPGVAETVLDLGLNDRTVEVLASELCDEPFAWRSYRRFIESYAGLVFGADPAEFEELSDAERERAGWTGEPERLEDWQALIARYPRLPGERSRRRPAADAAGAADRRRGSCLCQLAQPAGGEPPDHPGHRRERRSGHHRPRDDLQRAQSEVRHRPRRLARSGNRPFAAHRRVRPRARVVPTPSARRRPFSISPTPSRRAARPSPAPSTTSPPT